MVNKKLIHPILGVITFDRCMIKTLGRVNKEIYVYKTVSGLSVMLSNDSIPPGVREPITEGKAEKVLKYLFDKTIEVKVDQTTWNRRYREYLEKLQTGNIDEIAYVYKAFNQIKVVKDLSYGERRMLDQAISLLTSELALVLNMEGESLKTKLEENYSQK